MQIENLKVNRIAIHEVFQREEDRKPLPPVYADQLESWDEEALNEFKARVPANIPTMGATRRLEFLCSGSTRHL